MQDNKTAGEGVLKGLDFASAVARGSWHRHHAFKITVRSHYSGDIANPAKNYTSAVLVESRNRPPPHRESIAAHHVRSRAGSGPDGR